jgi:hypothetical protein
MSFGAKKLRVQLPCGADGSVIEEPVEPNVCHVFTCEPGTCAVFSCEFETEPPACQFPTQGCAGTCPMGTCYMGTCYMGSCHMGTPCGIHSPCHHGTCALGTCGVRTIVTPVGCGPASRPAERSLVVDADHLPLLRERLEAQLAEIEKAEQAVKERRESKE